ncbi:MAG: PQQ-binding-like beta-propeller repeat protein [Thermoproteota archaeon]
MAIPKRRVSMLLLALVLLGMIASLPSASGQSVTPMKQSKWTYDTVGGVTSLKVSLNGEYVVVGTSDGYIILFSQKSGSPLSAVRLGVSVDFLDITANGRYIAAGGGRKVAFLTNELGTLKTFWTLDFENELHSISLTSDGRLIAVGSKRYAYLFDSFAGSERGRWEVVKYYVPVVTIIAPNGECVLIGAVEYYYNVPARVILMDKKGSSLVSFDAQSDINSLAISSDGKNFAVGGDKLYYFSKDIKIYLWAKELNAKVSKVLILEGPKLVLASTDRSVYLFGDDGTLMWTRDFGGQVKDVAACSKYVAVAWENSIVALDLETGKPIWRHVAKDAQRLVGVSRDGYVSVSAGQKSIRAFLSGFDQDLSPEDVTIDKWIIGVGESLALRVRVSNRGNLDSMPSQLHLYDNATLVGVLPVEGLKVRSFTDVQHSLYLSRPGYHVISVTVDPRNELSELNEKNNVMRSRAGIIVTGLPPLLKNPVVRILTQRGTVTKVALSGDGYYLAAGTSDGFIHLIVRDRLEPLWTWGPAPSKITNLVLSSDGSYLAATFGNKLLVFSTASPRPLWSFDTDGEFYSLSYSADGSYLVAGSRHYVHLVETSLGITSLHYLPTQVLVALSPKGDFIVARRDERLITLLDHAGKELWTFDAGSTVRSLAFVGQSNNFVAVGTKLFYFRPEVPVPLWIREFDTPVTSLSAAKDGSIALALGRSIILLGSDNVERWRYSFSDDIQEVVLSADGRYLVGRSKDKILIFSTTRDGDLTRPGHDPFFIKGFENTVSHLAISEDGKTVSVAIMGSTVSYFLERPTPVTLSVQKITNTSAILSWSQNNDPDFLRYEVYVSTTNELGTIVKVADDRTLTNFELSGLSPATTYFVTVRVINAHGDSADSVRFSFTTPPPPPPSPPPPPPSPPPPPPPPPSPPQQPQMITFLTLLATTIIVVILIVLVLRGVVRRRKRRILLELLDKLDQE